MASLNFKGKSAVWNHHLSVPYHTLDKDNEKSLKGNDDSENLIIEGDNLLALKSLLPKYQGKIDCIYIDPPYNTGEEGWIYNDNVNSPLIKSWLGEAVGKDDLTRHDKWLCMMTPRLKLLRELLSENGVILISIDDNEVQNLKLLMNDIFLEENVDIAIWKKIDPKYDKNVNAKIITRTKRVHEFILIGFKNKNTTTFEKIKKLPNWLNKYTNPDNDIRGPYKQGILSFEEGHEKENKNSEYYYSINTPSGRKITRHFFFTKDEFESFVKDNRVYFPKNGDGIPALKIFENEEKDFYFETILEGVGSLNSAKKELSEIFGIPEDIVFDTPKPTKLIKELIRATSGKNSIILDSFAGSGTTAQAVMELNKEKAENRKYILVQLSEQIKKESPIYKAGYKFVQEITRERVERVIKSSKNKTGFTYYTLGSSIDADSILSGKLPEYEEFAKYVFYLATGKNHPDKNKIEEKEFFVGKTNNESIWLLYKQDLDSLKSLAITLDWADKINKKDSGKKIVYAPACFLDDEYLEEFNIQFVGIPYNLFEKK